MQLDGSLCILLYCPIKSHRIFLTSNCVVMPCSVPVNFPAVICLPFMPCCLSKESTSSELWTPVQSLPLIHLPLLLVYLMQTITFHTIRLILCYSKPVSLTTSLIRWGKVLSLCCAGLHVVCNTRLLFFELELPPLLPKHASDGARRGTSLVTQSAGCEEHNSKFSLS